MWQIIAASRTGRRVDPTRQRPRAPRLTERVISGHQSNKNFPEFLPVHGILVRKHCTKHVYEAWMLTTHV